MVLTQISFVISTFTFSMVLMEWGGAAGLPAVVYAPSLSILSALLTKSF